MTIGTKLFGLNKYWEEISEKEDFYYTVIRLKDEIWLDKLIYPEVRGYGKSWVYLDTDEKKKTWLSNYKPPQVEKETRRSIPPGLRFDVLRRDNYTCQICGRSAPEVVLELDHKIPWSVVRKHEFDNLRVSCRECNRRKSDKII